MGVAGVGRSGLMHLPLGKLSLLRFSALQTAQQKLIGCNYPKFKILRINLILSHSQQSGRSYPEGDGFSLQPKSPESESASTTSVCAIPCVLVEERDFLFRVCTVFVLSLLSDG